MRKTCSCGEAWADETGHDQDAAMITLTPVPGTDNAAWHVSQDGATLGIWQRTDSGATLSDSTGREMVTITAVGDGTAIVATWGSNGGNQWSDIAHKILAGAAGVVIDDQHTYPASVPANCPACHGEDVHKRGCSFIERNGAN